MKARIISGEKVEINGNEFYKMVLLSEEVDPEIMVGDEVELVKK